MLVVSNYTVVIVRKDTSQKKLYKKRRCTGIRGPISDDTRALHTVLGRKAVAH